MKFMILIKKQILKKPIGLFIIAIQITFAILIMSLSIGKINYINYAKEIFTDNDISDCYILCLTDISDRFIADADVRVKAAKDKLKEVISNPEIEYMFDMQTMQLIIQQSGSNRTIKVISYPLNDFNYKPILLKGKWVEDTVPEDNIYPAVISSDLAVNYKIGDRFSGVISGNQYEFKVCGILRNPNLVLDFNISGNSMNWSDFLKEYDSVILTKHIVNKNADSIENTTSDGISDISKSINEIENRLITGRPSSVIIKLKTGLSENEKNTVLNNLSNSGRLMNFIDINSNTQKAIENKTRNYTINYLLLIIISIIGIIGISVLNSINELSTYSIWYLCGSKWRNIYFLNFIRILTIISISILLSAVFIMNDYIQEYYFYKILLNIKHYIYIVVALLILLIFSNSIVFNILKKNTPADIMRRFQRE